MSNNWFNISQSAGTGNATITVNIQPNPGFELRTGRIIVSNGTISKTVSVVQNPKTPSLSAITVTANGYLYAPYSGGTVTSADSKNHLVVTAIYDNGDEVDVTSAATYASDSDEFTIPVSTSTAATFTQHWFYWRVEYQNKVGEYFDYLYQEGVPETNRIVYSGTSQVFPTTYAIQEFGATILASAFTGGSGIIVFDDQVTKFYGNASCMFTSASKGALTAIDIPSSLTNLGQSVFNGCSALTSVNGLEYTENVYLPPENAGNGAFYNCTSLTHCGLPHSYQYWSGGAIKADVFYGCSSLTTIIYNGTKSEWNAISKNSNWRRNSAVRYVECSDGTINLDAQNDTIIYYAPEQLSIADSVITPSITSHTYTNGIGTIKASGDITGINASGFTNCSGMTGIELPDSLESIGSYAFTSAMSLTNIVIPDSVTVLGDYIFWRCTGLTSVNIPTGITSIPYSTFSTCSSLEEITIPTNITTIGGYAFYKCTSLATINYNGTMAQWNDIGKGSVWHSQAPATVVHCTDGDVPI